MFYVVCNEDEGEDVERVMFEFYGDPLDSCTVWPLRCMILDWEFGMLVYH